MATETDRLNSLKGATSSSHSNGVGEEMGGSKSGISNGFSKPENGIQNGDIEEHFVKRKRKEPKMTTMEKDIISLIGQHLREKGFSKTLDSLVEESGCNMEHPMAGCFRTHVLLGQWNEAIDALHELSALLSDPYRIEKMRLLLLEEKFLEHLENGENLLALQCLRHDLVSLPIHHPEKRVQDLSQYLMCQSKEDLYRLSNWPGVNGGARQRLLDQLQAFLPPSIMLPPKRLELLLRQSVQLQVDKCPFHYAEKDISCYSLLNDHICQRSNFPSEIVHTLKVHKDEVWFVQFSHSGSYLASGSKDGNIVIWKIEPSEVPVKVHTAKGQTSGVTSLIWSPDDALLLSCGTEDCPEVIIFDSKTGEEKCRVSNSPDDSLTCACWHHSSKKFYVGGLRGQFYECLTEDGLVTNSWEGIRLHAVAAHPCNNIVFAADSHLRIRQYNFEDKTSSTLVKEEHPIMTFTLSEDARYALLNVASQGVHVWDLTDRCMIRRYQGVTQGYYTIHSCYGINDTFLASGSEDNHVYVWNKKRETPVVILQGHTHTVNSVAWNPVHHSMIASASDDCTIRVWGTEEEMKRQRELDRQKLKQKKQKNKVSTANGEGGLEENDGDATTNEGGDDDSRDDDEDSERLDSSNPHDHQYERLSQPISEMDLQALEMLDPDSSSQEENSNDRLEAAVSLSTLSSAVGGLPQSEITLNTQNTSRGLSTTPSSRGGRGGGGGIGSGMLVIVSTQGFHSQQMGDEDELDEEDGESEVQQIVSLPPLLSHQPSLESRSYDLDSSMESEGSGNRQLESLQSMVSEIDPLTGSSSNSVTVITSSLAHSITGNTDDAEGSSGVQQGGSNALSSSTSVASVEPNTSSTGTGGLSSSDSNNNNNNNGTTARTRSRLREGGGSGRSIATESSVSTVV